MRAFLFAAIASALGGALAAEMCRRWAPAAAMGPQLTRWSRATVVIACVVQAVLLGLHVQALWDGAATWPIAFGSATRTWVGRMHCVQEVLLLVAFGLSFRPAGRRAGILVLLVCLAWTAMSGHAVSGGESTLLSTTALLHVTLAGLWFGGLGPLWAACRVARTGALGGRWAPILKSFSRFALPAMLGVLASGAVLAWWSVGRWAALFGTAYGWVLLAKLVAVAAVLASATRLRRWSAGADRKGHDGNAGAASRWLAAEQWLACGVVIAAGTLARMMPAAHDAIRWPFGFRLDPTAAWQMRSQPIPWSLAAGSLWLVAGASAALHLWRRQPRLAVTLGAGSLIAGAALVLPSVTVDAYPTSYSASAAAYDTSSVARGETLYRQHCTACHGLHARGDGPLAPQLKPAPANLTEPHLGWHSHGDMYWWLTHGFPNSAMPGFAQVTTDAERWHLINYLTALSLGYQARNLGERPAPRDPWLSAIDFRYRTNDGGYALLSELRGGQAALLVLVGDKTALPRLRTLELQAAPLARLATRVIVVLPRALADQVGGIEPGGGSELVIDDGGDIAAAWGLYRRTLATPDFRDEQPRVARIEYLIDRFGFVRARWRSDERPGEPTAAALTQAVTSLAREPELRSPDVHAH